MMLSLHVSLTVKYSKNPEKNEIMSVFRSFFCKFANY